MHDATDHILFDGGRAPNPRRVAIFLAEKQIEVTKQPVDMGALEHKAKTVATLNPLMQLPLLKLPDGTVLTESIAICRYFEALFPEPNLFGIGAKEMAQIEMWQRRIELEFVFRVAQAFRHTHRAMADWEVPQVPEWGEANRPKAIKFAQLLNQRLAEYAYVCGDRFTVADITAIIGLDLSKPAKIIYPEEFEHLNGWADRIRQRKSYVP